MAVNFAHQAERLAQHLEQQSPTDWLGSWRARGLQTFLKTPWPTRKTEAWKYTSLFPLTQQDYNLLPSDHQVGDLGDALRFGDLDTCRLVFVNGVWSQALSDSALPEGVEVTLFSQADAAQRQLIQQHLGEVAGSATNLFGALNNGLTHDGLLLQVQANQVISKPLQVVHVSTRQENAFTQQARVLLYIEPSAEATLIEQFVSADASTNGLTNSVTECQIGANARLHHYRLHMEDAQAIHLGGFYVNLMRDAQLNSFMLGLGGLVKRIDAVVNHCEPGAHCDLNGVYALKGEQHFDFHTCIEHRAPHCTTDEVFRGLIDDQASAVFNGRIHIHPHAQKTRAEMSNKNLLLSNQAEINTKPELEIYADDVKCAHGATVSQLDDKALFYLLSRGIDRAEAELLLSFGFINALLDQIKHEPIQQTLRPLLADLFAADHSLTRHLV